MGTPMMAGTDLLIHGDMSLHRAPCNSGPRGLRGFHPTGDAPAMGLNGPNLPHQRGCRSWHMA